MSGNTSAGDTGPLFVLATRLYVHYKFKTRTTFSPEAALIDDDYAREVLARVRITRDRTLLEMADRFEAARFPAGTPAAGSNTRDSSAPVLDLSLDSPG
jgi:hypothetical protein